MYRNRVGYKFDTYFFDILPYFRDFKSKLFYRFYTVLRSDRVFRYFFFLNCYILLIFSNELNRSNVRSLISLEYKIYLAWRIKMLNRSIFKFQFEVAD